VILLIGIVFGLIAGSIRAWLQRQPFELPNIQRVELALISFIPQALIFFVPQTGRLISQDWAALVLPLSLGILVLFVWCNRRLQGFWLLGVGLLLNLTVIVANGGLMPVSPSTLATIYGTELDAIQMEQDVANRAFGSKSVVLPVEETRLEWLADRFTVPDQLPIQFAYSLGDLFLVMGAFWALFVGGTALQYNAGTLFTLLKRHTFSSHSQRGV
jgi:hypothetical protein